jgi:hypothetical protein
VVLGAVSLFSGQAEAQMLGTGYGAGRHAVGRPTVSPYLNLIASDALNQTFGFSGGYQTMVRPAVDGRRAINANAAAIAQLQAASSAYGVAGGSQPGRAGVFMNYSHYYPGASGR